MSSIINFLITTNKSDQKFDARYPSSMALVEFKIKLEMVVGIYRQDMRLELRDQKGKLLSQIVGDDKTLEELGIKVNTVIHVIDVTGNSPSFSTSDCEKYTMSDESYNSRADSVRKWKQKLFEEDYDNIKVGKRCQVVVPNAPKRMATITFVGEVHFKPGVWVGVKYDESVGKNDGSIEGHRYFECQQNFGGFVQPKAIIVTEENGNF